ncbi:MAG: WG repeat-containing protein, partial [Pyrinomonadaceae bacterium]
VMNNDKFGFIDKSGETVISLIYDNASPFSDGLSKVMVDREFFFIDKKGNKVLKTKYNSASDFIDGMALVEYEKRKFFINKLGEEIFIPFSREYTDMAYFDNKLIQVKISDENNLKGKFGFIDKSGNEVIPVKYDWIGYKFISNLIQVRLNNKYFYIGRDGTEYFED